MKTLFPISLDAIRVQCQLPSSPEKWKELRKMGKLLHKGHITAGPILPNAAGKSMAFLDVIDVRHHSDGDGTSDAPMKEAVTLTLTIRPRPSSPPPAHAKAASKKAGGMRGLYKYLKSCQLADCIYTVEFSVSQLNMRCTLFPQYVSTSASLFGRNPEIDTIGYQFSESAYGLSDISVAQVSMEKKFDVFAAGVAPFSVSPDMNVPFANTLVDVVLRNGFESV